MSPLQRSAGSPGVTTPDMPAHDVDGPVRNGWATAALVGVFAAIVLRVALLPTMGMRDDTDQFVGWVHQLATGLPFGDTYRMDITFPPVMAYVFWALAHVVPAYATAQDAADPIARAAIKIPACLADIGLILAVAWLLRERPRLAIWGGLLVAFVPLTWYLSAWWGQFESIYVLLGLIAAILVTEGRPIPGAIVLGLAVMTKPQALPFLVPFAAYAIGRYGARRGALLGAITGLTVAATWLPFLADGGPGRYLSSLGAYQNGVFAVMSIRAWNLWWLVQQAAGGGFFSDTATLFGPVTPRLVGYGLAGLAELVIFVLVARRPDRDRLLLGLTASVLAAFALLTTMHERYAYGAVIFALPVALSAGHRMGAPRWAGAAWVALAVVVSANMVAAVAPSGRPGDLVPVDGPVGIAGSAVMILLLVGVAELVRRVPAETAPSAPNGSPAAHPSGAG
jgi:Gpi18-like mannosyltransferase